MQHPNARLTPIGRLQMAKLVEERGLTFEAAAAAWNVAKSTVHDWVVAWRAASVEQRRSLACLEDRAPTPKRSARRTCAAAERRICRARRRTG